MTNNIKWQARERGIALIVVLFMVVVMLILVGSLLELMPQELRQTAYVGYDNRALYIADSGIQDMTEKIEEAQKINSSPIASPPPYYYPADVGGGQAWYQDDIVDGPKLDKFDRKYYLIEAFGHSPTGQMRHVRALLQQRAFSQYDYFTEQNSAGNYFVAGLMTFNGPVYLGATSSNAPVNITWYNNLPKNTPSIFQDTLQLFGPTVYWQGSTKNSPPTNGTQWAVVDSGGQNNITPLQKAVDFPQEAENSNTANEAFNGQGGTTIPNPSSKGVYMDGGVASAGSGSVTSGIFVQGSAAVQMTASPANTSPSTQTFTFTPGGSNPIPDKVTVTLNFTSNTTTVTEGSKNTTYAGLPNGPSTGGTGKNGAIFVNGDISSLQGTVNGQYSIVTPDQGPANGGLRKNITVTGDITMQQDPQTCNCQSSDLLGLITNNLISQVPSNQTGVNRTIEAAIFSGNKTESDNGEQAGSYETQYGAGGGVCGSGVPLEGNLVVYGSLVNNYTAPLGCFDPSSGNLVHGWSDSYVFDNRFKTALPPFYPLEYHYSIVAWQDEGVQ